MRIFAISDLHLGIAVNKPMAIFGKGWENHMEKIRTNWIQHIKEDDIVLIPGDISWGINLSEATDDLDFIHRLPGYKICIRGNHDYWWEKIGKLNKLYHNIYFLQNTACKQNSIAICGTRGWVCPNTKKFTAEDEKIYKREAIRLELSLKAAKTSGAKQIIGMLHYPPTNEALEDSIFTDLFEQYGVEHVIYGHLHGEFVDGQYRSGMYKGISYNLVSADYLEFVPLLLETRV